VTDSFPISRAASTVAMLTVFALSWLHPIWPYEQALHNSLTVIGFALLWRYTSRLQVSRRDYFFIALFFVVHSIAARWLYTNVPYDQWTQFAFGFSLSEQMGWTRNHFDRLVHCLFGVCFTPVIASYAARRFKLRPVRAFQLAVTAIMVLSLWYEWFELAVAMTMSGADAESYNGQQGDMWDAHKDMLIATTGSLLWGWHYLRVAHSALPSSARRSLG
jgi:putative membrane protein